MNKKAFVIMLMLSMCFKAKRISSIENNNADYISWQLFEIQGNWTISKRNTRSPTSGDGKHGIKIEIDRMIDF